MTVTAVCGNTGLCPPQKLKDGALLKNFCVNGTADVRFEENGVYIFLVFTAQHLLNFFGGTPRQLPTILFALFVVFQLFNAFSSRELAYASIFQHLESNKPMLGVFALTFALQVVITQFCGAFFGTVALPFGMWLKIIALAMSVIVLSELMKLGLRAVEKKKGIPFQFHTTVL